MTGPRGAVDAAPLSAFVQEMDAAFMQRCQASTPAEKEQAELKWLEIMRRHLPGRAYVPRVTANPANRVPWDRKTASVGPEAE